MSRRRTILVAMSSALLLTALAACSGDSDDDATTSPASQSSSATDEATDNPTEPTLPDGVTLGLPDGVEPPANAYLGAGWDESVDGQLWVVSYGSSTNPTIATEAVADGQTVTVTLAPVNPGGPATADFQPTTSVIAVTGTVDQASAVEVILGDFGTVQLVDASTPGWLTGEEG